MPLSANKTSEDEMGIVERMELASEMTEKVEDSMIDKVCGEDIDMEVCDKEENDEEMPVLTPETIEGGQSKSGLPTDMKDCPPSITLDTADGTSNSSGCSENEKTVQSNNLSACTTPVANRASNSNSLVDTPPSTSGSKKRKRLTPEERLLKDQERQEKRRKLEEEKQRKEQERLDRLKIKEEERKKREEEKRIREEEKKQKEEERIKKAEEERVKKEEERVKKEEERIKKEEERKKKEEERLQKEEQKRKKEDERKKILEEKEREKQKAEEIKAKQAQLFTKFFTPKSKSAGVAGNTGNKEGESDDKENKEGDIEIIEVEDNAISTTPTQNDKASQKRRIVLTEKLDNPIFDPMPFQVKTDMNLAPLIRRTPLSTEEKSVLDKLTSEDMDNADCVENMEVSNDESGFIYFKDIKTRGGRKSLKTEVKYDSDIQVITGNLIENPNESGLIKWRMKLLQFSDNRRPAYWGTYKRKPLRVTGRRPFSQEEELDYEFDSDDEWEDEPEDGEDLENSENEKEPDDPEGVPEDEEDEEGWMVPHGYLSDGEGGEHQDLEIIKSKEKEFYKSLKQQIKMGLPVIETEDLNDYKVILFPKSVRRKIRRRKRSRKATSPSHFRRGGGILSLELPSEDEDDSWTEASDSESCSDSDSSDSENESGITSEDELTPNEKTLSDSEYDSDSDDKKISSAKHKHHKRSDNSTPQMNIVPLE